jgi:hypothetical protein
MRTQTIGRKVALAATLLCLSLLLAFTAGCGSQAREDEGAADLSIEEFWERAQGADTSIESWHMEIASYYENTQYGSGQIQSIIIDVSGEDMHEQDLLLGQVYFEYKRVGGRQYNKDMESGTWAEVPAEQSTPAATEYTSQFLELPSLAETQEHVGADTIDGRDTEHFRFTLSPEGVKRMFSAQPSFDFTMNTGGEVEVWIDGAEYYMVRYELVIRDVIIPEKIGNGDIRFVVNIRNINEPIDIKPPPV